MPKLKPADNRITVGSGNVFADLGLPDSDELLVKAELLHQVNQLIECRSLTQAAAASLLGVSQPNVSALKNGRLSDFSLDRLIRFLVALGQEVNIRVRPAPSRAGVSVTRRAS